MDPTVLGLVAVGSMAGVPWPAAAVTAARGALRREARLS
jgi:hypothetical protein